MYQVFFTNSVEQNSWEAKNYSAGNKYAWRSEGALPCGILGSGGVEH
jgi:hypothetical protein